MPVGLLGKFSKRVQNQDIHFKHVCVLFGSRYNHLFHKGIAAYASRTRWHLTVTTHPVGIPITSKSEIDGILVADQFSHADLRPLLDRGIPGVCLIVRVDDAPLSLVIGDNVEIGRLAGEHFKERGFRHFAFVGSAGPLWSKLRMQGFRDATRAGASSFENLETWPSSSWLDENWTSDKEALAKRLQQLPRPCALFCAHDPIACSVLQVCLELGLKVPEEVAILGADNDPLYCGSVAIPISSVIHDLESIGFQAAQELDRLIDEGSDRITTKLIPPLGVSTRRSTDHRAIDNQVILAALRFIEHNHSRNIGVTDVATSVSIPLRTLQHLFRKELNESVVDCITRIRLARAQEWLARSTVPIAEVAAKTGFTSSEYFHRIFKAEFGFTPQAFRKASKGKI